MYCSGLVWSLSLKLLMFHTGPSLLNPGWVMLQLSHLNLVIHLCPLYLFCFLTALFSLMVEWRRVYNSLPPKDNEGWGPSWKPTISFQLPGLAATLAQGDHHLASSCFVMWGSGSVLISLTDQLLRPPNQNNCWRWNSFEAERLNEWSYNTPQLLK